MFDACVTQGGSLLLGCQQNQIRFASGIGSDQNNTSVNYFDVARFLANQIPRMKVGKIPFHMIATPAAASVASSLEGFSTRSCNQ